MASWNDFWDSYGTDEAPTWQNYMDQAWSPPAHPEEWPDKPVDIGKFETRWETKGPNGNNGGNGNQGGGAAAELANILQGFGLKPGQFHDIIDKAIRNAWSPAQFESAIYRSRPFKQAFPGIFRNDGSLRMSPYEYLQQKDAIRELAQRYGLRGKLDDKRIGTLIEGDVSLTELNDRFTAITRMEEYRPQMEAFAEVLKQRGVQNVKMNDEWMYRFIMGEQPKQFYTLWEQASVGGSAARAGIDLNARQMKSIAKSIPGVQSDEAVYGGMQELAAKITTLMPLSKMAKFGITKKDLIELQFGGKNQAAISQRVQELINVVTGEQMDERKAFDTTAQQSGTIRTHGATS